MGYLGVGLLLVLWAWLLLPRALRSLRGPSPVQSVMTFERAMDLLAATRPSTRPSAGRHILVLSDPAAVTRSSPRARVLRRRRAVCARFAAAVPLTGLLGLLVGGVAWLLFALAFLALGGYVVALARVRARQAAKRRTVRRFPVGARTMESRGAAPVVKLRAG